MHNYNPPLKEMLFVLRHMAGIDKLGRADLDEAMLETILDEAGKLARDVLAPLNKSGDLEGSILQGDQVKTPKGFKEAYAAYRDGGWNGVPFNPEFGGQGLPWLLAFAVQEMWQSANLSFGLCPLLNQAAVDAIEQHGTAEQKNIYLAKLISGQWTGTMNLTESHAGSDLGLLKAKAVKQADGTYKITGQKIFITYGEHDLAENIIHTVLARLPDAPEGVKGISLFLVPKFIPDAQGNPGTRNDIKCAGLEHKLGIHASPTCVMQYGEQGGATGWLIGRENEGLRYMFTMMNNARLSVGLQGVAVAERAYQQAFGYANERVQGTRLSDKAGAHVAIIEHPDVRRMLLLMKAQTDAGRMMTYEAALMLDRAHAGDHGARARVELLTPIVKAWCTDMAVRVASEGIQVHGGMGFIEETGAAQYYRDARIPPIYEGTNGIQSMDLALRKVFMNKGQAARAYIAELRQDIAGSPEEKTMQDALDQLERATALVLDRGEKDIEDIAAVSVPYLNLFGGVVAGCRLTQAAHVAQAAGYEESFCLKKRILATFFATHVLPQALAGYHTMDKGGAPVAAFKPEMF